MMSFLTGRGKEEKEEVKIGDDFSQLILSQMKRQFCNICQKSLATKVAFGENVQPSLTCSGCELKAVGGVAQRMTEKNLITFEKFV